MNETQSALWMKLESFNINNGNETFTFEMRLARENRWSMEYVQRVMAEYRRFLFLCAAAGHPCSPSDQVDQAWHLHLTYTRSYWERLCGTILPAPLHHEPTTGGAAESSKFDDWYERTLSSYRTFFGSEPPLDIWPPTHLRFEPTPPSLVKTESQALTKTRQKRVFAVFASAGVTAVAAIGCDSRDRVGIIALLISVAIMLILAALVAFIRTYPESWRKVPGGSADGLYTGCGSDSWISHGGSSGHGNDHGGHSGGHTGGHDGGSHGCGGHGCGGHGCGGHGCGSGCGGGGH